MDDLLGVIPGGPWLLGAVALLAIPGVRQSLRPLAKGAIKVGMNVTDQVKSLTAEAREQASDIYEEAKVERQSVEADDAGAGATRVTPAGGRGRRVEPTTPTV
jgi:hypothetical protein